jgi:hypothetical protein
MMNESEDMLFGDERNTFPSPTLSFPYFSHDSPVGGLLVLIAGVSPSEKWIGALDQGNRDNKTNSLDTCPTRRGGSRSSRPQVTINYQTNYK